MGGKGDVWIFECPLFIYPKPNVVSMLNPHERPF